MQVSSHHLNHRLKPYCTPGRRCFWFRALWDMKLGPAHCQTTPLSDLPRGPETRCIGAIGKFGKCCLGPKAFESFFAGVERCFEIVNSGEALPELPITG